MGQHREGTKVVALWRAVLLLAGVTGAPMAMAQTIPLVPRAQATGFSGLEQRFVYAPPDKGEFSFQLTHPAGAPNEAQLEEGVMCREDATATATVKYDKAKNTVKVSLDFDHALPYRLSYTRPYDVSTPYNQMPLSVQNGKWQMWFVGQILTFNTTFYYSATTLQLLGNEHEFPGGPPPASIPVTLPAMHMIGSPMFEGQPNGNAHAEFTFRYDQILDDRATGGVIVAFLPYNLCKPDQYGTYYTTGGLPVGQAMNFDDVLKSIWSGNGISIATSLEPDPKPAYLNSRDNNMIGWSGAYPAVSPLGAEVDPVGGVFVPPHACGTRIAPPFPAGYFNICGG